MSPAPDSTADDPQQTIADLQRANADLQRANAELQRRLDGRTAERDEALDREAATAEVLQVINSSPGDLAPVFDAMLEKATRLCEAPFGTLRIWDGEGFHLGAAHVEPRFRDWLQERGPIRPDRDASPLGRILAGERVVRFADVPGEEDYQTSTGFRKWSEASGVRSAIWVALRKDDALLGTITVYRREVRPFSDKQIALLQNFAAQAVIAMENARLIAETREALEQQTATAEVLGVINRSPGELAPVFDAILDKALSICGAMHGGADTYDGARFNAVARRGGSPAFEEFLQSFSEPLSPFSGMGRIAAGESVVHIADIADDEAYRMRDPMRMATVELLGARTCIWVALRKEDTLLGALYAYREEVRPFTDRQVSLLENFAAQAVIAMENARLITETREALEQQTATAEVLGVINSSPGELGPVFDAMLEKAHSLCDVSSGSLQLYDSQYFHTVATRGMSQPLMDLLREPYSPGPDGLLQPLIAGARFLQIDDQAAELATQTIAPNPRIKLAVELDGIRSALFVPLRKNEALLGMISCARHEVRPFTDKQIALLENFAAQAVIAIENARLLTETREALEQQTATAEVLQVINSSPGDPSPVFDAILEKAHTLCGVTKGALVVRDGNNFGAVATRGLSEQTMATLRQPFPTYPGGPHERLLQGERLIHIPDQASSEQTHPIERASVESGTRTLLFIPLRKDGTLLGYITAARREVRPFTDKHIALLENFAAQAVIAMENARLLGELRQRTEEVGELNRDLEVRVAAQVDELGRVGRLKRFLAPQLAELIVSQHDERILESHRREIVVVFCDLRGYTAFTETAEPEEVLDFLRQYHGALGPLVSQFEGTLDQFSGDGIMVFFNDPVPCPDPAERAVKMAVAMRSAASTLIAEWRERGRDLGFGAGIAQGYATLGQIGFSERSGYTAIGTVCNVAARLCAEAKDGQILLSQLVNVALRGSVTTEQLGPLTLKGLTQPVVAYNVPLAAIQPALRVIEGGSPQTV